MSYSTLAVVAMVLALIAIWALLGLTAALTFVLGYLASYLYHNGFPSSKVDSTTTP